MLMTIPYIVFVYRLYGYGYGPRWVKNCLILILLQLWNGFMGIIRLLMLECVILRVLEKIQEIKLSILKDNKEQTILGVTVDNKLTFKSHIENWCKKASQKIGVLSRLLNHLNVFQIRKD